MTESAQERAWSVADAKARISELLDQAISDGPQTITRRGRQVAVVVSAEEWRRKTTRSGSLAEFLAASPLRESDLDVERAEVTPRDVAV